MKEIKKLTALAAAAIVASATAAAADTLTVDAITGTWSNPVGGSGVAGEGTNVLSWGSETQRSEYIFSPIGTPESFPLPAMPFVLGVFTHDNRPIPLGSGIDGADLDLSFDMTFANGGSASFSGAVTFAFLHDETPNSANPCADGGANGVGVNINGCADAVQITNATFTDSVVIGKLRYTFKLLGFLDDDLNEFETLWTQEDGETPALLWGAVHVAPIPLPAAGFLLLGALGGLGLMARRKAA